MTYRIVQLHKRVTGEDLENWDERKQKMIRQLVLAELTEGLTPLVYATVVSMAYYGPNRTILGNVKCVEDVANLFQTMLLLFGIDIVSMIVNSQILLKLTDVNLYEKACDTLKSYWPLMAVKFALYSFTHFATKDINLGMDTSGGLGWTTQEGRIQFMSEQPSLKNSIPMMALIFQTDLNS